MIIWSPFPPGFSTFSFARGLEGAVLYGRDRQLDSAWVFFQEVTHVCEVLLSTRPCWPELIARLQLPTVDNLRTQLPNPGKELVPLKDARLDHLPQTRSHVPALPQGSSDDLVALRCEFGRGRHGPRKRLLPSPRASCGNKTPSTRFAIGTKLASLDRTEQLACGPGLFYQRKTCSELEPTGYGHQL